MAVFSAKTHEKCAYDCSMRSCVVSLQYRRSFVRRCCCSIFIFAVFTKLILWLAVELLDPFQDLIHFELPRIYNRLRIEII